MAQKNQFEKFQKHFEKKRDAVFNSIVEKHSASLDWLREHKLDLKELKQDQVKRLAAATATGMLLLTPGSMGMRDLPEPQEQRETGTMGTDVASLGTQSDPGAALAEKLREKLQTGNEPEVEKVVGEEFKIPVKYEIDGYRMNVNTGLMGAEQHLYRWAGDTVDKHLENDGDRQMFGRSGIAPNRGAYGYFGNSGDKVAADRERYYFAVQTFLSPTWQNDVKGTYNFFRFRKMIAINTKTGQAVVGVVGDAGPAKFTGKSFGGSPEVMHYVGLGSGPRKGEVLMLFVDDPTDQIPLGPVKIGEGKA